MSVVKLQGLYKFKKTKPKTSEKIYDTYTHKKGFYVGIKEDDFITIGTVNCRQVYKMRGEYPNFEREPKYNGIIYDPYKKFIQVTAEGLYQEVEWERVDK